MTDRPPSFRRMPLLRIIVVAVVLGLGALIVWGFIEGRGEAAREAERERPVTPPRRVSMVNGAPVITLNVESQKRSRIETTVPAPAPYQEQVRAYATVLEVARLIDLNSSYANANAQRLAAHAKLAASSTAFERAQKLYQDQQNVSLAQLQAAEAAFRTDQAALTAAESQVRTLATTAQQEWGPVLGKSLIDGSSMITRLLERQDFLLQVTLPPGVILAAPPATAAIQTGQHSRIAIIFVSPATRTDPKIQGVSFFYLAPANSGVLPGMNVLSFLSSGRPISGVTLPAEAIIWWQGRAWVYHRTGSETFTRAEIATDLPAPGGGYVVKDFAPNTEIVTRGAQLLLSEEFRAQIQIGEDEK
ncbi:MAG: efflux RND transporter periplasmic adaptor subunit [Gammaproteobacteria bacterium]|nr:efflux RND transporter periplasmic adaptor subunit [Gammaproteobacteria bacterium]